MWTVPISNIRGFIKILWLKLYVCLILTSYCSLSNGWIPITIFFFTISILCITGWTKMKMWTVSISCIRGWIKFSDYSFIPVLSWRLFLFFQQWMNINYNKKCRPFQFQTWEAVKKSLMRALCLSYLDLFLFFKQWMKIN